MRFFVAAVFMVLSSASAFAADVKFVRVWPSYRTANSFMRISEYFTGNENPGRKQTLLRTLPAERGGFYFLTRIANRGATLDGAQIQLHVITPRSPKEATFTFPTMVPHGEHVFHVGLTGPDWPIATEHPVAWRMAVLDAGGNEVASEQSFLWSKPDRL